MADHAPKSNKPARPAKKASTAKAKVKPAPASKGPIVEDNNNAETPQASPAPETFAPEAAPQQDGAPEQAAKAPAAGGDTIQSLKDSAATITRSVGEKAKAYAEDNKSRAGGALDELAKMIGDAAATVDEKVGPQYGQYARTAADTVTGFSDSLKAKNVDDLIADATSFVKKSPAIAIGTAAAIGFVLIRLVQSGLNADTDTNTEA